MTAPGRRLNIGDLHLSVVQSLNLIDPEVYGFDSTVEFPPHAVEPPNIIDPSGPDAPAFTTRCRGTERSSITTGR
jgi:hypothetical protein